MELKIHVAFPSALLFFRIPLRQIFHFHPQPRNKMVLFKRSGTEMHHHKTPGAEPLKQTAADMWNAISANVNSGFLFF